MLNPRAKARFRRHVVVARPPFGLVSPRYLWPGLTRGQRIHRHLLASGFPGVPRPVATALNAWHWVRWTGFVGWRTAFRTVGRRAAIVEAECGISRRRQLRSVLWCALVHGMSPREFYQFQLYRPERRARAWEFVYEVEADAFHRWRSGDADLSVAYELLADKHTFAVLMLDVGVPVVATIATVPEIPDAAALATTLRERNVEGAVFCKPRRGSGGRGVFRIDVGTDDRCVRSLDGQELSDDGLDRVLAAGSGWEGYVIQPYVETHPLLAGLGGGAVEGVTLRLITSFEGDRIVGTCAYLEVPLGDRGRGHVVVAVDTETGEVDGTDHALSFSTSAEDVELRRQVARDAAGRVVPRWAELVEHGRCAHRQVPGVHAVAWDFIVAPYGPVLLEGNTTWGTAVPQVFRGPFLAEGTTE